MGPSFSGQVQPKSEKLAKPYRDMLYYSDSSWDVAPSGIEGTASFVEAEG